MDLALVNLYYGKDKTPASALSGPGADPLTKPVAAGRLGVADDYVFGVPKSEQDQLTVEFSYTTDAPDRRLQRVADDRCDRTAPSEASRLRRTGARDDPTALGSRPAGHVSALRRFWRSVVLCTLLGIAVAVVAQLALAQPTYESTMTFFVATSAIGATPSAGR